MRSFFEGQVWLPEPDTRAINRCYINGTCDFARSSPRASPSSTLGDLAASAQFTPCCHLWLTPDMGLAGSMPRRQGTSAVRALDLSAAANRGGRPTGPLSPCSGRGRQRRQDCRTFYALSRSRRSHRRLFSSQESCRTQSILENPGRVPQQRPLVGSFVGELQRLKQFLTFRPNQQPALRRV